MAILLDQQITQFSKAKECNIVLYIYIYIYIYLAGLPTYSEYISPNYCLQGFPFTVSLRYATTICT